MNYDQQRNLEQLHRDFSHVATVLKELIDRVMAEGVTRFPILIAHQEPLGLGLPVIAAEQYQLRWNFRISHLEELVGKGLVRDNQVRQFKLTYEHPRKKPCILIVPPGQPEDASFVFIPFGSTASDEIQGVNLN